MTCIDEAEFQQRVDPLKEITISWLGQGGEDNTKIGLLTDKNLINWYFIELLLFVYFSNIYEYLTNLWSIFVDGHLVSQFDADGQMLSLVHYSIQTNKEVGVDPGWSVRGA